MKKAIQFLTLLLLSANVLTAQWTQIPNLPIPVAIDELCLDGNNVYAGTQEGVFKSSNNGNTWAKLNLEDLPYDAIGASGNNVCVFSTYNGLFHYSTDGGATFQLSTASFSSVSTILVQGNKVFVLANSGFFISDNQGATFTRSNIIPVGYSFGDLVQTPAGKILTCTAYNNQFNFIGSFIFRSTDDVNWTSISGAGGSNPLPTFQSSGRQTSFSTAGYLNGVILAGCYAQDGLGAFYQSNDLGANWFPVDNNLFSYSVNVVAFGSSRVFISDGYQTQTSTDGVNWTVADPTLSYLIRGSGTKFIGTSGYLGQLLLTTDNGNTWTATHLPPGTDIVRDYLSSGNTKFLVTQWNGIFRGTGSNPDNLTWTKVLGGDYLTRSQTCGNILKKGNTLLAGLNYDYNGNNAGIYRSTNNGTTWTQTHPFPGRCLFDDGTAVYAGIDGDGIYKSVDAGQTWAAVNNGLPYAGEYSIFPSAIIRSDDNLIASFMFYGHGIYISPDNGNSWTQAATQEFIYCLAKSGSFVFAGCNAGLMRSSDDGATWEMVQNEALGSAVTKLSVQGNKLYIGTGQLGLLVSTDAGETCEFLNEGVENNAFISFIGREGNTLLTGRNVDNDPFLYNYVDAYYGRLLWQQTGSNVQEAEDRRETVAHELHMAVYPNPVRDMLQFTSSAELEEMASLQVFDASGKMVREQVGADIRPVMDVHDLTNGIYFLQMTMLDGKQTAQRFMVMKPK